MVTDWIRDHPGTLFMHDNAPPYTALLTREDMEREGLTAITWPAYSPDLNPIENVWNVMKDYIQAYYPAVMTPTQLKAAIKDVWEAIEPSFLDTLVKSMDDRVWAVFWNDGGPIDY